MRAIAQREYGDASTWAMAEVDRPSIKPDQVLVEVRAAGLDRGTWHLMEGLPLMARPALGLRTPRQPVPGRDLAGTVVEVGADVTRFQVGDEVLGVGEGSFAQYTAAKERKLVPKPAGLGWAEAAILPISGITAWQATSEVGRVADGQRVLVLGASGGVGSFAVQVAKAAGAEVNGVARAEKLDFVRSLGADHVIDHRAQDPTEGDERYDLIIDIGGCHPLPRLRRILEPHGTAVIVGGEGGGRLTGGFGRSLRAPLYSLFVRPRFAMIVAGEDHERLGHLVQMVESGQLTPALDRAYPLEQAAEAMARLDAGEVCGKLAITVEPPTGP